MSNIEKAARILAEHRLEAPTGGTAGTALCTCSCGVVSISVTGTRDHARWAGHRHVAQALADAGLLAPENTRTESAVKAEALYDLAAHMETLPAGTRTLHDPATIRAYADRNHPRKDQQ